MKSDKGHFFRSPVISSHRSIRNRTPGETERESAANPQNNCRKMQPERISVCGVLCAFYLKKYLTFIAHESKTVQLNEGWKYILSAFFDLCNVPLLG